jgi:predicted nuclease of restriction endonuclease-like (RecB) superfamily
MKTLKNDSAVYVEQIEHTISECYVKIKAPSNAELMELYRFVGQCICAQGEKAFVVHLAEIIAARLPHIKGFSPRNLRRMRDFFRTYESRPDLMRKTHALGWTQNTIILECCLDNEQREFYIDLAIERNLSKLSLMREIEAGAFEKAHSQPNDLPRTSGELSQPVSDVSDQSGVDKAADINVKCGPCVSACEPSRQGNGVSYRTESNDFNDSQNKDDLLRSLNKILIPKQSRISLCNCREKLIMKDRSPLINDFPIAEQCSGKDWIGRSPPDCRSLCLNPRKLHVPSFAYP